MPSIDLRVNGWPKEGERTHGEWKHSDIRNVIYLYNFKVYDKFVDAGDLK